MKMTGTSALTCSALLVSRRWWFASPAPLSNGLAITPLGERFVGVTSDIAGNSSGSLEVYDFGRFRGNSRELGILLVTNGDRGAGAHGAATADTEGLVLPTRANAAYVHSILGG